MQHLKWFILALIGLAIRAYIIELASKGDNYYDGDFSIFTDLDYKVYLDASLYQSPYERHTYRYSPVLSYMVAPSYPDHQLFGKYLIAFLDVIAAYFFYKIYTDREGDKQQNKTSGIIVSMFSYLNPFLIFLGTRGSCEGVTMTLATSFWYFYFSGKTHGNITPEERREKGLTERQPDKVKKYISYIIFGLWVHFRVYPIIFVPMLIMHEYHSVKKNKFMHALKFTLEFGLVSGGVFLALGAFFYYLYGYDFLHQTYLYHLTRRDNRHSKSVFFYDLYLNYESDALFKPLWRVIFRNLPTLIFVMTFSFYFIKKRSVFYCQGFLMIYFVLFNRVITDQYYLWLFNSIILVVPETQRFKSKKYGSLLGFMTKVFLLCAPSMIIWGVFKAKFQGTDPRCHMLYFWGVNVLNFLCHFYALSPVICDETPLENQEQSAGRIKND